MLSFVSCGDKGYPDVLVRADSLTSVDAEHAILLLDSLKTKMKGVPERDEMYYRLLCLKARDKAFLTHENDNGIKDLLRYYQNGGDKRLLPEVLYYAGRVYRDLGDAPQALDYFQQAVMAIGTKGNVDLLCRIYSQEGYLFMNQRLYDDARRAFESAMQCSEMLNDSVRIMLGCMDLGRSYARLQKYDKAVASIQRALPISAKIPGRTMYVKNLEWQLADFYVTMGETEKARVEIEKAMDGIHPSDRNSLYTTAVKVYDAIGQRDSVKKYAAELIDMGSLRSRQFAAWHLAHCAAEDGDYREAFYYMSRYKSLSESLNDISDHEAVTRVAALYNYNTWKRENLELAARNRQLAMWAVIGCTGFVALLLLWFGYAQYTRRRRLQSRVNATALRWLNRSGNEGNAGSEAVSVEGVPDDSMPATTSAADRSSLKAAQPIVRIKQIIANRHEREWMGDISAEEWKEIEQSVNQCCPGFSDSLLMVCDKISPLEYHVCLLLKCGIPLQDIAYLTKRSREAITSLRRRLYRKVFDENGGPKDWDEFIAKL